MFAETAL